MAVGKRWYEYLDDGGTKYAVQLNKNMALAPFGFAVLAAASTPRLPTGFRMRTITAVRRAGTGQGFMRRTFPVAKRDTAIFAAKTPTDFTYDNTQFSSTGKQGEQMTFASLVDTGI
jgi:hypothetical protein